MKDVKVTICYYQYPDASQDIELWKENIKKIKYLLCEASFPRNDIYQSEIKYFLLSSVNSILELVVCIPMNLIDSENVMDIFNDAIDDAMKYKVLKYEDDVRAIFSKIVVIGKVNFDFIESLYIKYKDLLKSSNEDLSKFKIN